MTTLNNQLKHKKGRNQKQAHLAHSWNNNEENKKKAMDAFTSLLIERIENIKENESWEQPWFNPLSDKKNFIPQNMSGRCYSLSNQMALSFLIALKGYKTPVFLTFLQAKQNKLTIRKGEKSFPVFYFRMLYIDKETYEEINVQEYESEEQMPPHFLRPLMIVHNVFNIDQTDMEEKFPEDFSALSNKFYREESELKEDDFSISNFDELIEMNKWICPIKCLPQDEAFFHSKKNFIAVPQKKQFLAGELFYATVSHEMVHSTMKVFPRPAFQSPGDELYAREELVAELGSALIGLYLGTNRRIEKNNVLYLDYWLKSLRETPNFLFEVLGDTKKAVSLILQKLGVQEIEE